MAVPAGVHPGSGARPVPARQPSMRPGGYWIFFRPCAFPRSSTAPSSRSMARCAPGWQIQPRRRSRYQIPGTVYRSPNFAVTRSRTGARVRRWAVHPAASGPAPPARISWPLPPDLLPTSSALGGQPAALCAPHAPCTRHDVGKTTKREPALKARPERTAQTENKARRYLLVLSAAMELCLKAIYAGRTVPLGLSRSRPPLLLSMQNWFIIQSRCEPSGAFALAIANMAL